MDAYFRAANGEKKKFHRKIQKDGGKEWNERNRASFRYPFTSTTSKKSSSLGRLAEGTQT